MVPYLHAASMPLLTTFCQGVHSVELEMIKLAHIAGVGRLLDQHPKMVDLEEQSYTDLMERRVCSGAL